MLEKIVAFSLELSALNISVITLNLLLMLFADPILRRVSSPTTPNNTLRLRCGLFRALNAVILLAYSYHLIYQPRSYDGPAFTAIAICAVLYGANLSNYLLQSLIAKHYGKVRKVGDDTLYIQTYQSRLFSLLAGILVSLIAIISVIRLLGFDSLLEAGGVLGIVGVFLALTQASWAPDIISGLIILNSDMFEEGDIVEIDDTVGRVHRTKLFHTEIINIRNNHRIMLRNANIRDKVIHNLSKFATGQGLRECLKFNIDYDVDGKRVREIFSKAFQTAIERDVKLEPNLEAQACILDTGDHAITWGLLFHIKNVGQLIAVRRQLREIVLEHAKAADISLATPLTHTAIPKR